MAGAVEEAWAALADGLEARKRELVAAVREYPTPIARCDVQLPEAIERRNAAVRDANEARELESAALSPAEWGERVRSLAGRLAAAEDGRIRAASSRLLAELGAR